MTHEGGLCHASEYAQNSPLSGAEKATGYCGGASAEVAKPRKIAKREERKAKA